MLILVLGVVTLFAQYNKEYFLWSGRQLVVEGHYRDAISTLNSLIRVDSRAYEAYFLRSIAKYNLGDLIGAEGDLNEALRHNPLYTNAYTYRAITRARLGNYDDALRDFAMAIELRPDIVDPYFSRGVTRLMNQQFDAAIEDFSKYISHERRVSHAHVNRGICYLHLKDTLSAFSDFSRAIESNRNNPDGYSHRGALQMKLGDLAKAQEDLDQALECDSMHLYARFTRALLRNDLDRPMDAIADFDHILASDPSNSLTHFNRAILLSQIGDYNRALEGFDEVVHLSPDNVLIYFYRANIRALLGDAEGAERDYTSAIDLYPDFANAYLARSNVRYRLEKYNLARHDKELGERKIAEHQARLQSGGDAIYNDPMYNLDRLMSFDTKLSSGSLGTDPSLGGSGDQLISQYRFTLSVVDSLSFTHHKYYDKALIEFIDLVETPLNDSLKDSRGNSRVVFRTYVEHEKRAIGSNTANTTDITPDSTTLWINNFRRSIEQGLIKQYTTAIESITDAILAEPSNPFLLLSRATLRSEMIEFISSIDSSFQQISIESITSSSLTNKSSSNRGGSKYDYGDALSDVDQAIALHPNFAHSHYNRAAILVLMGELPEAYAAYSQAIALYPAFAEAYYNRGVVQLMMKDSRKGILDLSKAGELGISRAYDLLRIYSNIE